MAAGKQGARVVPGPEPPLSEPSTACRTKAEEVMPLPRAKIAILDRYVFFQLFGPFCLTILVLSAVFLMTRILDLTDLVVNYRVGLSPVLWLLLFTLPYLFTFVFPMACLLAVLLTVLRMSADSEITALKAGGCSLWRLLVPVMAFCLLASAATGFMAVYGLPWGRTAMTDLVMNVARKNIEVGLSERTFNDTFKNVVLYVNELDEKNKVLKHVFIEDRRQPGAVLTVSARRGRLLSDPERGVWQLALTDGSANQVNLDQGTV
ncbi:MAG: LptF/LptG family permease, partial [Proteobacteria bacterium]|nr:LptF/LptG family permease [Pseudomonadota bacterium]